jgi:hypothetical protein
MATSPNYAWAEPDNSSLVKNGASDIRTLGDAIDTSVWNVGFGQAGKNKFINGDFTVNQRAFTTTTTSNVYMEDRWQSRATGDGTTTHSIQTFTPGTAPVAGYEGSTYHRIVTTGQTNAAVLSAIVQRIESVRTFAGQTVTLSFWAKAASGTPSIAVRGIQSFGTGGSSNVEVPITKKAITTSWARYSYTFTVPSISGKTIGTANDQLAMFIAVSVGTDATTFFDNLGIQTNTFDFWGLQVEYGSKATPFQTASGGSPQAELAMCQRYYYQNALGVNFFTTGAVYSGTSVRYTLVDPVQMRTTPTGLVTQNLTVSIPRTGSTVNTGTWAITYATPTTTTVTYTHGSSVLTAGDVAEAYGNNANSYIGWSAEL